MIKQKEFKLKELEEQLLALKEQITQGSVRAPGIDMTGALNSNPMLTRPVEPNETHQWAMELR